MHCHYFWINPCIRPFLALYLKFVKCEFNEFYDRDKSENYRKIDQCVTQMKDQVHINDLTLNISHILAVTCCFLTQLDISYLINIQHPNTRSDLFIV